MTLKLNTVNGSNILTKNSAREVLPYVAASCCSVNNDESWINPLKLHLLSPRALNIQLSSAQLKANDKCFFDRKTGLKISLIEGKKEVIVAFGALGSAHTELDPRAARIVRTGQMVTAVSNLMGFSITAYEEAAQFVQELSRSEQFKNKKIVLVGQSLGGSLAQYAGLKTQLPTYCFNPLPLGRAQIKNLKKIDDRNVQVISTEGDYATGIAENSISSLARWVVHTPNLFGKKFKIPSAYSDLMENHTYFMGSLMKYLGYDIRTKFEMIPPYELYIGNRNEEFLNIAATEVERIIENLNTVKRSLDQNDKNIAIEALKNLQADHPHLFSYLSFLVWFSNEGRDLGDRDYGSRRLLNTPFVLNKIQVKGVGVVDALIDHFNAVLFLKNAKKTFLELPEKTKQLSQELLQFPFISDMKNRMERVLISGLNDENVQIATTKTQYENVKSLIEALIFLLEESDGSLENFEGQKTLLHMISEKHPSLYSSLLQQLKIRFNPNLELKQLEQLLLVKPSLLLEKFGKAKNILTEILDGLQSLQPIYSAIDVLSQLKGVFETHFPVEFEKLVDQIEELELFFSLANMQQKLHKKLHEGHDSLKISPPEATKASRFSEQIPVAKRVYMVCAECNGVIKKGGLAEAVLGVAEGLRSKGYEVTLIMPKYDVFQNDHNGKVKSSLAPAPFEIKHDFGNTQKIDRVFKGEIHDIEVLFIEDTVGLGKTHDHFALTGNDLYEIPGDVNEAKVKERFAYFSKSASELIKMLRQQIDVVFFHDWHGALGIPLLARKSTDEWLNGEIPPLLYVFHNNGYAAQGELNAHQHAYILDQLALPHQFFNATKEAISLADGVITVSESYSREVQGREGNGLQNEMRKIAAQGKFTGITNGSNPNLWNPEVEKQLKDWIDPITGENVPLNFSADSDIVESKKKVKEQLQKWLIKHHNAIGEKYGIDLTKDNVILYVGRFDASQKGLDKFRFAMRAAKEKGATFIVMGSKENSPEAVHILNELEKEAEALKDPKQWGGAWIIRDSFNKNGKLNFQQGTEDGIPGIGHLVRASANINFCPSEYEPCGLTHLEGFAYGQLTVGTNLGGYADIINEDPSSRAFNGFLFPRFHQWKSEQQEKAVFDRMCFALDYCTEQNDESKNQIMSRLMEMSKQYSWTTAPEGLSPIEKYEKVMAAAEETSKTRGVSEAIEPVFLKMQN
jgi:starch synthase